MVEPPSQASESRNRGLFAWLSLAVAIAGVGAFVVPLSLAIGPPERLALGSGASFWEAYFSWTYLASGAATVLGLLSLFLSTPKWVAGLAIVLGITPIMIVGEGLARPGPVLLALALAVALAIGIFVPGGRSRRG